MGRKMLPINRGSCSNFELLWILLIILTAASKSAKFLKTRDSQSRLYRTTVIRTSRGNRTELGRPGENRNIGWPRFAWQGLQLGNGG